VVDRTRHAPSGRYRRIRNTTGQPDASGLSQVYRGRARRVHTDIFESDHVGGGHARWFLSTCLLGAVGLAGLAVVIYGFVDHGDNLVRRLGEIQITAAPEKPVEVHDHGLNWAMPKSNMLEIATSTLTARYVIHEQVRTRRNNRPFIEIRPYMRIVARLAPKATRNRDVIPPFNPFKLYSTSPTATESNDQDPAKTVNGKVNVKVVELLGGILPGNDGQELDTNEISAIIQKEQQRISGSKPDDISQTGILPENLTPAYLSTSSVILAAANPHVTEITRTVAAPDTTEEESEAGEVRVVRVAEGDTLSGILKGVGANSWQIAAITEVALTVFPPEALRPGQEIHLRMVQSLTNPGEMEPNALSIFDPGHVHRVTIKRDESGEFTASTTLDQASLFRAILRDSEDDKRSSLYASIYDASLTQNLSPELIMKNLRIHAYETDYRRQVQNGDRVEMFFDLIPQTEGDPKLGEMLFTSITSSGETNSFWRFRTSDGLIDYYDEKGQNSKKFLMRKPVRAANVRLTSGFGPRFHPVTHTHKMHYGVDWAAPRGTPILAAGSGVIEEARYKGTYGNYVRIRHANGYKTAYGHMRRIAAGIHKDLKVEQGRVIGYIGTTGLSSGPHLHFEVLVNNRRVNPLRIEVPRARRLQGEQLTAFLAEKHRIDELMRRPPVKTHTR
jgi:murein DD-endopeptidase MepM/ murein hydrolase activator NlpD